MTVFIICGVVAVVGYLLLADGNRRPIEEADPAYKKIGETQEQFASRRKKSAIAWAKTVLENKDQYVILDTETTGLGKNDVVVQIGIIDLDGNTIIESLVRPTQRKRINPEASAIHGIKMANLKDAPTLLDMAQDIDLITKDKTVIIYNAEYDENLLFQTMQQDGFKKFLHLKTDCAMQRYSDFINEWSEFHGSFKFQRLPGGDHTAVGDCRATLEVIKMMAMADEVVAES
jgi:DNA polymerase-3 subunit epsilon